MAYLNDFYHYFMGDPQKPKLVFLHGLLGFSANWRTIARGFEKEYHILVYDQRGHGKSIKPPTGYRPEDYAEDLRLILDELGWDSIDLVGHSMGGRNALSFAFLYPKRVRKLVIEDIGPESNMESYAKFQKLFASVPTPFVSRLAAKEFLLNDFSDPVLGHYLYTNLEETPEGAYDWRFSKEAMLETVLHGRGLDRWDEFAAISCPMLVIRGKDTDELSFESYQRMIRSGQNVRGIEIPNAGHWVHFDQPQVFIRVVASFLAGSPDLGDGSLLD